MSNKKIPTLKHLKNLLKKPPIEKMFTQSEANKLAGNVRQEAYKKSKSEIKELECKVKKLEKRIENFNDLLFDELEKSKESGKYRLKYHVDNMETKEKDNFGRIVHLEYEVKELKKWPELLIEAQRTQVGKNSMLEDRISKIEQKLTSKNK